MTEPQVWALIGVFAAAIFGMFTIISTLFVRTISSEIRAEVGALRGEMNGRFDRLEQRVDGLDRDVQALVKHTFGIDRG
jgi:ABC-type microcin C transport system permease subunit YejE